MSATFNTVNLRERIALCKDFSPEERDFILLAMGTGEAIIEVRDGSNYLGRIDAIWAALSIDDGGEGVCAIPMDGMTLPLIAADKRRLSILRPAAQIVSTMFNKPVRIAKFTKREDMEIFQPKRGDQK